MLRHGHSLPVLPERVVVLGAGGFVARAAARALSKRGAAVLALARADLDLAAPDAAARLAALLRPGDAVVMAAARAPVKDASMFIDNLRMMEPLCTALRQAPPAQVVYISSDAVYADSDAPLTEASCAQPGSLHGAMHLTRELMLADAFRGPLCLLRPTLIYGAGDPHNGYGPNRFRRLARRGEAIVLFGEGEERRDHVHVDDVGEIAARCVLHRSEGVLNVATGTVASFREIAEQVAKAAPAPGAVRGSPRNGPMPHRGYRPFDPAATRRAFPDFVYTPLAAGLARSEKEEAADGGS